MGHHQQQRVHVQSLMMAALSGRIPPRESFRLALLAVLLAGWFGLSGTARAQFPLTTLRGWSQSAWPQGSRLTIRPVGSQLDEAQRLYLWPGGHVVEADRAEVPGLPEQTDSSGTFTIDTAGLAPGIYDATMLGRFGISNPRRVIVSRSDVQRVTATHTNRGLAIDLQPGTIYEDQCVARARQYYRIRLRKGQQLRAVMYASIIDARTIGRLVLKDPDGRELAKGVAQRDWPARVECIVPDDGDYYLEAYDLLYRGGDPFRYLLQCAVTAPGATSLALELDTLSSPIVPVGGRFDRLRFADPLRIWDYVAAPPVPTFLKGNERDTISFPTAPPVFDRPRFRVLTPAHRWLSDVAAADGGFSSIPPAVPSVTDRSPRYFVADSNRPGHIDFFATKGEVVWIEVASVRWNQLTDPHVLLYRVVPGTDDAPEQLQLMAERDDGPTVANPEMNLVNYDPLFSWTVPENGRYRLVVRDNQHGLRPAESTTWCVQMRSPQPGFAALAWPLYPHANPATARPQGVELMRGGTVAYRVLVARRDGFNGRLQVRAVGLPDGVTSQPCFIAPGINEGVLILHAHEDAPRWTGQISIVVAEDGAPATAIIAVPATVSWEAIAERNAISWRLCGQLMLHISDRDVAPLLVQLGDGKLLQARQGEKVEIPIRVVRRDGGDGDCTLRPQNLPPKVGLGEIKIAAAASEAKAIVSIAKDAPPGRYTFWMMNETKVKWRNNPQAVQRLEEQLNLLRQKAEKADPDAKPQLQKAIDALNAKLESARKNAAQQTRTVWMPTTVAALEILPAQ